jgi:exodeoxyribonuclease V gamma subunit
MVWSILEVAEREDPRSPVTEALEVAAGASRYAKVRRIADLFDRYHLHRPDMVRSWAMGESVDGALRPIADHAAWQPRLWRAVRSRIDQPSPPELLAARLDDVRNGSLRLELPGRLMLFGFTVLPGAGFLELAQAVATWRDVHLFLLEPFRVDVDAMLGDSPRPVDGSPRSRSNDLGTELVHQPLLRSWGRLYRETAVLVSDAGQDAHPVPEPEVSRPATLLARLQDDIRADRAPGRPALDASDRSIQFHACYGPTRQVEVLRDALLHLLAEPGSDLTEDDIVVLCPALERFAPLVEAVFGASAEGGSSTASSSAGNGPVGAPSLRYRIADQSIRSTNPVLGALSALLQLAGGRFEAVAVVDFLSLGPVRERHGFDDDDLATVTEWAGETNVRWGLDAEKRVPFGVPAAIAANTWQAALDRLLVGSAVFDSDLALAIGDVAPYGVEGGDVDTVGRLAEVVWHLADLSTEVTRARPLTEWVHTLRRACDALFAADRDSAWQIEALHRLFGDLVDSATVDGVATLTPLTFLDIRRMIEGRVDGMPGRPDFFRGGITVTSMTPLRWIPFRVVCLLGMDQSAFGSTVASSDDLITMDPHIGDRDSRSDDRAALLEAVLAAGDHLLVFRDGHDVRTNQEVPRAVVTAELFDAACQLAGVRLQGDVDHRLEIDHPRQPFDERYFVPDGLVVGQVWGFDATSMAGAVARRHRSSDTVPFLTGPLPPSPVGPGVVDLVDLRTFFANPASYFLTRRLEARLPRPAEELSTVLPVQISHLERYRAGNRLLKVRLAGGTVADWASVERASGTLPPGLLEQELVHELAAIVDELVAATDRYGVHSTPTESLDVEVELDDGTRVIGSVPVRLGGELPGPAGIQYSKVRPRHRIAAWLDLLMVCGTDPSQRWRSVLIGQHATGPEAVDHYELVARVGPGQQQEEARRALAVAVGCLRRGWAEPIPLFPTMSFQLACGGDPRSAWSDGRGFGDGDDEAVRMVFDSATYREIMALEPEPDDPPGPGRRASRFATYLWDEIERSSELRRRPGEAS